MIDLATLTGACVVALGSYYAAMYSTTDELADMLNLASKKTGECVWRMPLDPRFDKMNDSKFADMRNVTNTGQAGSITAAEFLKRFIDKTESWVHLDIAGVSDVGMESNIAQKGCSTAFGIKLLNQFVADNLE
jgi:leucyl aminopeptidase